MRSVPCASLLDVARGVKYLTPPSDLRRPAKAGIPEGAYARWINGMWDVWVCFSVGVQY